MTQRIALFLRKTAAVNDFNRILRSFVSAKSLSGATVTSGFFQEDHKFKASDLFKRPCTTQASPTHITFVGVYNSYWVPSFISFGINLSSGMPCSCCTTISFKKPKGAKWHAKVFVGSIGGRPRFGIIGSSNLTRPAAGTTSPFNYEADAVMWHESDSEINGLILERLERLGPGHVLVSTYAADDPLNAGISLEQQLAAVEQEILSAGT
ncbi:hypothetical protein KIP31_21110 [Xanthomonas campestris pv. campestris]|uniref:hypothetical protein n=1 Tax=Xanthomonas campestris TaxID=339 RepID=UPI001F243B9A|nr:hypothetical protein [Xanthomonas campestris]MCF8811754.1 hypothetical protein [Xanthomonas campestris pv. campestris]MCW2003549.1 hypothetical protein [Xanthomonas campestris]